MQQNINISPHVAAMYQLRTADISMTTASLYKYFSTAFRFFTLPSKKNMFDLLRASPFEIVYRPIQFEEEEEEEVVTTPHVPWVDEEEDIVEDDEEDIVLAPGVEEWVNAHAQPGLRRHNTMITNVYEDEYVRDPVHDEGIAFDENEENIDESQQGPLPIVDVINGNPYVKVGNVLLRAGTRKRDREEYEDEDDVPSDDADDGVSSSSGSSTETLHLDERPTKKYRRTIRPTKEKRLRKQHVQIEDAVYEAMEVDLEWLQVQQEPSDVRMMFLGRDGLDDAPTPPGSPRRTVVTEVEFDFE